MNIVKTVIKYLIDQSAKTIQMLYHGTARLYQIHTMLMHIHMHLFKLFIYRIVIDINTYNIEFIFFTRNVGVAEW